MAGNPYLAAPPQFWPIHKLQAEIERLTEIKQQKYAETQTYHNNLKDHCNLEIRTIKSTIKVREDNRVD